MISLKFLQDTLDTLFGILDESPQRFGLKVFDCLVSQTLWIWTYKVEKLHLLFSLEFLEILYIFWLQTHTDSSISSARGQVQALNEYKLASSSLCYHGYMPNMATHEIHLRLLLNAYNPTPVLITGETKYIQFTLSHSLAKILDSDWSVVPICTLSINDMCNWCMKKAHIWAKQEVDKSISTQVHVINLLQDSKFQLFKPVMDNYIENHFAGALSYR